MQITLIKKDRKSIIQLIILTTRQFQLNQLLTDGTAELAIYIFDITVKGTTHLIGGVRSLMQKFNIIDAIRQGDTMIMVEIEED